MKTDVTETPVDYAYLVAVCRLQGSQPSAGGITYSRPLAQYSIFLKGSPRGG